MNRRQAMSAVAAAPAFLSAQRQKMNVLWIIGDDLGPLVNCYGYKGVKTPNIDRLATEGTRFTHAFTTAPVCSASRSAFNTGVYQISTGTHNHRSHRQDNYKLPGGVTLINDIFRQAGYFTANVRQIAPGVEGIGKTDFNFTAPKPFDGTHWNQRAKDQPFYAQINFIAPHKGKSFTDARKQKTLIDPATVQLPPYYPDHPVVRDEVANYLDAVQLLDYQVGVALDALKKDGLLENTAIFFFGDNGRCLIRGKQWLYDAGTHVPLIARCPGAKPGAVREDPVSILDMTAQSLVSAGLHLPAYFHGQPLFDSKVKPREYVYTCRDRCDMTVDRIRAIRSKRYKYIRNFMPERPYTQYNEYITTQYPTQRVMKELHAQGKLNAVQSLFMAPQKPQVEFYDLHTDPHEVNNLAGSTQHKKLVDDFGQRLDHWLKDVNDLGAIPESKETIEREEPRANAK